MKVLYIIPNFDFYVLAPPLGILYLSSYIKKYTNANVVIVEALRDNLSDEQILNIIEKENPNIIGIHCLTAFYKQAVTLCRKIKSMQKKYIVHLGGVHPTFMPYTTLKDSEADFVVVGEGEIPIKKIIDNNLSTKGIQGVYTLNDLKDDETQADGTPVKKAETVTISGLGNASADFISAFTSCCYCKR